MCSEYFRSCTSTKRLTLFDAYAVESADCRVRMMLQLCAGRDRCGVVASFVRRSIGPRMQHQDCGFRASEKKSSLRRLVLLCILLLLGVCLHTKITGRLQRNDIRKMAWRNRDVDIFMNIKHSFPRCLSLSLSVLFLSSLLRRWCFPLAHCCISSASSDHQPLHMSRYIDILACRRRRRTGAAGTSCNVLITSLSRARNVWWSARS